MYVCMCVVCMLLINVGMCILLYDYIQLIGARLVVTCMYFSHSLHTHTINHTIHTYIHTYIHIYIDSTPFLAKIYTKLIQEGKQFEVVFCSRDKSSSEYESYFDTMPWKSIGRYVLRLNVCMYVCVYVCMYVCMVYMSVVHSKEEREKREADRNRNSHIYIHTLTYSTY